MNYSAFMPLCHKEFPIKTSLLAGPDGTGLESQLLRRLKQEDGKFKDSLGLGKKKKKKRKS